MKKRIIDILITALASALLAFLQSLVTGITSADPASAAMFAVALKTTIVSST